MNLARTGARRYRRILLAFSIFAAFAAPASAVTVNGPGLSAPGSISYDALGTPTIQAATQNDVAFLQGYAQAQARFFEMDFDRRAASGTLAELVGGSALASDVQTRTLGLGRAAWATWSALDDDTKGWLQSFSDGVNFWLQSNALPPEYGALMLTRAEPWTPVDSITVGKGLAFQLSFDLDIQNTIDYGAYQQAAAAANVDPDALFFVDTHRFAPPDDHVTIPGFSPSGSGSAGKPFSGNFKIDAGALSLAQTYRAQIASNPFVAPSLHPRLGRGGSNEFAVSGANTADGKPLIANDPHLTLALPPIFMEMHLITNDRTLNATGVSVPGAPGIIQGCNSSICWGSTVNPMDVTDTFLDTFAVNSYGLPTALLRADGTQEPVQWEFQTYYVNQMTSGSTDNIARDNSIGYTNGAVTVIVPRHNNGPVVQLSTTTGECSLNGESTSPAVTCGLSIAYTGWGATFELKAFKLINLAQNIDQFQNALTYFDFGSQNFAYADTAGNIAYFTSAENPIRDDLQNLGQYVNSPPFFIRDGSGAAHNDWLPITHPQPNQAIPFEIMTAAEMPHVINPSAGYFANANNDPIGVTLDNNPFNQTRPDGGIYYLNYAYDAYRMGRIDRSLSSMIASGHKLTTNDIMSVQLNNQPVDAQLVLPYLLTAYDNASAGGAWAPLAQLAADPAITEAISRLRAWDLSTPTGLVQGFDAGRTPGSAPTQSQLDNSVAATEFFVWRSNAIKNTIDATLTQLGLADYLPGDDSAYTAFKFLLDAFPQLGGKGASGIPFFNAPNAPDPASARDYILLASLQGALAQLSSDAFAPAYANSTDQSTYHWGALHRFVLEHPLGGPFNIPGPNPYGFTDLAPNLPGLSRDSSYETVNPGGGTLRVSGVNDFMFSGATAPGRRFVGQMDTPINAFEVIPGGESAVLGDPNYASQLLLWLTGNYHPLVVDPSRATSGAVSVVSFTPGG
ncbi:MAG TPA: penicillin acylase family protein [Rudaea sp.]|jgi:penicillin amidase|nr:penicillin acylase family protein [Rudaea sp.]